MAEEFEGVKVEIESDGVVSHIKLNGVDFSQVVAGFTFQHNGRNLPTLEVLFYTGDVDVRGYVGSALIKSKKSADWEVSPPD
jgi:hypothetical protein